MVSSLEEIILESFREIVLFSAFGRRDLRLLFARRRLASRLLRAGELTEFTVSRIPPAGHRTTG